MLCANIIVACEGQSVGATKSRMLRLVPDTAREGESSVSIQIFLRLLKQLKKWSELPVQVAAGVTLVASHLLFLEFIGAITFIC
jgi:hypothetical protein